MFSPTPRFQDTMEAPSASALRVRSEKRYTPPGFNQRTVIRAEKSTSTNPRSRALLESMISMHGEQ